MQIEKTLTDNEWRSFLYEKLIKTEILLLSVLEIQALILKESYNISFEESRKIINDVISKHNEDIFKTTFVRYTFITVILLGFLTLLPMTS